MNDANDKTSRQLYQWMAGHGSRIGETDLAGKTRIVIDETHRLLVQNLCTIEAFVEAVMASELPVFRMKAGIFFETMVLEKLPLSEHVGVMGKYPFYYFPSRYRYSCRVELFMNCWMALGLNEVGFHPLRGVFSRFGKESYEHINDFVSLIRSESTSPTYKRKAYDRENQVERNCRSATRYIAALYKLDSGLHILRFEFFYRSALASSLTAAQAKQDLGRLLNNRRGKSTLFAGCVGHLWILHHGSERGWHVHLIFFYSGEKAYANTAREIGHYWNEVITRGHGRFWHRNEILSDDVGSETCNCRDSQQQRRLLVKDVCNLIRSEQYLCPAQLDGKRNFGKGERKPVRRPESDGAF